MTKTIPRISLFAVLCTFPLVLGVACENKTTAEDASEEIREAADTTWDYVTDSREEFIDEARDEMDRLENDWIRAKAKAEGDSKLEQELAVLNDEVEELLQQTDQSIDELEKTTGQGWKSLEKDVRESVNDLRDAIEDAKHRLS